MKESCSLPDIDFPTDYMFKAFAPASARDAFRTAVKEAVNAVVLCPDDAIRVRESSGGKYICVTALAQVSSREQLLAIYAHLREIDQLMFLL